MADTPCDPSTKPKCADLATLHATIELLDSIAQGALSQIAGIAKTSLLAMESPAALSNPDRLANVLTAISDIATLAEDSINDQAESVGCNHCDPAWLRRLDASAAARKEGGQ